MSNTPNNEDSIDNLGDPDADAQFQDDVAADEEQK